MYLEDCSVGQPAEPSHRASGYSPHIADAELALRLWDVSEKILSKQ